VEPLHPSNCLAARFCRRGRARQSLPITDLPLPTPLPDGAEWIEAYRRWRAEGYGAPSGDA